VRDFRISDRRHRVFDGYGAALHGARWNSPGRRIIYCAETYSGARLEQMVHLPLGRVPATEVVVAVEIPDDVSTEELSPAQLPGWNARDRIASRANGDRWYDEGRSAVLLVPSVAAIGERNVLINQEHADTARIVASAPAPVVWDERLFERRVRGARRPPRTGR
jgi:RES domain-containing protein